MFASVRVVGLCNILTYQFTLCVWCDCIMGRCRGWWWKYRREGCRVCSSRVCSNNSEMWNLWIFTGRPGDNFQLSLWWKKQTNKQKQVFLMRPQDFSSCVWWHEEVFLMRPQDFSSCACVVTKIGILTQNKTFFLTLTKWLWCLNLPRSKRKWNTRGFKHSRWIHKRKLHLLFLSWFKWFDAQNGGKTTSVSGPPFQGLVPFYYIAFNI